MSKLSRFNLKLVSSQDIEPSDRDRKRKHMVRLLKNLDAQQKAKEMKEPKAA